MKTLRHLLNPVCVLTLVCLFVFSRCDAAVKPNVVIILVDDMGYGDPTCYNAKSKIKTPHIDSIAAAGMRFTDAHASGPLCHVSRYGLMTGSYPFRGHPGQWSKRPTIEEGQMTIASMLKDHGYRTAMVGKWHLGFHEDGYENPLTGGPVDRGFDSYFGIRASTDIPPYFYIRNRHAVQPPSLRIEDNFSEGWTRIQGEFWRAGGIAPDLQLKDVLPRFTDEAIVAINSHTANSQADDQPLMLYLAYPAPHTPWLPSAEFQGKNAAGMYGDFAMMVDAEIGRVLRHLKGSGIDDNTLLIFSSDNGPVWYPNDIERFGHDSVGGLRGMKADAWEGGHRMPFIVRWPSVVSAGRVSDQLISFVDVMATLADILGVSLPTTAGPDSFSFHSVLTETPSPVPLRSELVVQAGSGTRTLRSGNWKLIDRLGSGGFSNPKRVVPKIGEASGQLYSMDTDLAEANNLFLEQPDIVIRLSDRLKIIEKSAGHRLLDPPRPE